MNETPRCLVQSEEPSRSRACFSHRDVTLIETNLATRGGRKTNISVSAKFAERLLTAGADSRRDGLGCNRQTQKNACDRTRERTAIQPKRKSGFITKNNEPTALSVWIARTTPTQERTTIQPKRKSGFITKNNGATARRA